MKPNTKHFLLKLAMARKKTMTTKTLQKWEEVLKSEFS